MHYHCSLLLLLLLLLLPAGDMAGATIGSYIISRALKYNMPKRLVLRMLINQAIDSCVGVVPFLGDLFDFGEGGLVTCYVVTIIVAQTSLVIQCPCLLSQTCRPTQGT
jgi:hypothetical protein